MAMTKKFWHTKAYFVYKVTNSRKKRFSNADLTKVSSKKVGSCSLITSCNPSISKYTTTLTSPRPKALPHGAFCLLLTNLLLKVKGIVIVCCCYENMAKHRVNLPLPTFAPCAIVCIIRLSCKKRELGGVDVRTADTVDRLPWRRRAALTLLWRRSRIS